MGKKPNSRKIYQIIMAIIAVMMILSMIVMAMHY
jgi:hypothetical protein